MNKDPCKVKWLPCLGCRAMTSFNTESPIVDRKLCDIMRHVREQSCAGRNNDRDNVAQPSDTNAIAAPASGAERQAEANVVSDNGSGSGSGRAIATGNTSVPPEHDRRQDETPSIQRVNNEEGRNSRAEDSSNHESGEGSVTEPSNHSAGIRRSKRSIDRKKIYQEDDSDSDDSRFSAGEDDIGDDEEHATKRSKLTQTKSEDQENDSDPDSDRTPESEPFHQADRLFRIRQFINRARDKNDKVGVKPSRWCIENNYCASSDGVLVGRNNADEAMRYLRESNIDAIKDACREYPLFAKVVQKRSFGQYCGSYQRFACMEKGDIVAMLVPGPGVGNGEAYFGVITSNKLLLMTPDEAPEKGFPAMHLFDHGNPFNGLMLREVQWLRKGRVRDLPYQKRGENGIDTVPWLTESVPFWLLDSSKHVDKLKKQQFMDKTEPL